MCWSCLRYITQGGGDTHHEDRIYVFERARNARFASGDLASVNTNQDYKLTDLEHWGGIP